jgi:hypothetical protein
MKVARGDRVAAAAARIALALAEIVEGLRREG